MSLFESASLVVTPNGAKASKLYAIKPTSGAGDLSVTRATTATRVNSAGLIESVASNVPRLDYTNSNCPSILVEPQRTNLLLNSETVATQTIASLAQVYTLSFYGTGTITISGTHSATVVGTGTTRKTYTFTAILGALVLTVSGTCTNGQLEAGSYATSYIPTTSASVTRNADVISKTGISDLIGQTEGTIFLDFVLKNPLTATNRIFSLTETTWDTGGSIRLDITSSSFTADFTNAGTNSGSITYNTTPQQNTRYKVAIAYKENDCKLFINGVDRGSDTSTNAMPTCSQLYLNALGGGFNAPYEASNINTASLWKTRLTNAELAELTTI